MPNDCFNVFGLFPGGECKLCYTLANLKNFLLNSCMSIFRKRSYDLEPLLQMELYIKELTTVKSANALFCFNQ